ncbi:MAG: ATP-binding protein [Christensenellales bacterium]|jgi:signal transduction histidine kinase
MFRSVFLRRILVFVAAAMLFSSTLTLGIYYYASRQQFANIKVRDLLPQAQVVAQLTQLYYEGAISQESYEQSVTTRASSASSAKLMVFDGEGSISAISTEMPKAIYDSMSSFLPAYVSRVLQGETVVVPGGVSRNPDYIFVGVPVMDRQDNVVGSVIMFNTLSEASTAMSSLTDTLVVATAIVIMLLLPVIVMVSSRLTRPIKQMRDVANAMAGGNFSVRANDMSRDEIGDLGYSLNYLSTALSHTIKELRTEKHRLLLVLNGLKEGIVAVDNYGNVTHANPAVLSMFRQGYGPIASRQDIVPNSEIWDQFDAVIEKNQQAFFTITQGQAIIQISISPMETSPGNVVGAVGLFSDITEQERLEQTRRDYVANVSHELRTPLTALRGLVEPLKDGLVKSEADRMRYYEYILRETLRLSRLIDDLLELSRLQSSNESMRMQPFDIGALLTQVAQQYTAMASDSDINFELDPGVDYCPQAVGNADRVQQVLVILLDNALKFTPAAGKISLSVEWSGSIVVSVCDTGPGIAEEDAPYVFDRFYKADKAHSDSGIGLGLSIAQEIIQKMGQRIWVENREGSPGACFSFTLDKEE